MAPRGFVVAIDGPSGAGKTAAGMQVAERIGAVFVDTGIFYRALTLLALQDGVPIEDAAALTALVGDVVSAVVDPPSGCRLVEARIRGVAAGDAIRAPEVEARVSEVAGHPDVRAAILELQREAAHGEAAIVAGRDIGTVVFPAAPLKVYLDASPDERARRRALQLGFPAVQEHVAVSLAARDAGDVSRPVAPLARAADAIVIDTDRLSLAEVVAELEALVNGKLAGSDARP